MRPLAQDRPLLVLFCDSDGQHFWQRWLRPGFRHVFAALPDPDGWTFLDPLSNRLCVTRHPPIPTTVLVRWFRRHRVTALPVRPDPPRLRPAIWEPLTCVVLVKRLLGLDAPFIHTPWQLYRHLGGPCPSGRSPMSRLLAAPKPRPTAITPAPTPAIAPPPATGPLTPAPPAAPAPPDLTAPERDLLRRGSGRAGTVLTGWRGLLAPGALAPRRKNLLGE